MLGKGFFQSHLFVSCSLLVTTWLGTEEKEGIRSL